MGSFYRQQLEDWLKTLDVKADTVLGIGDSQNPTKGRTKSWDVNEYKILDLPEPHITKQKPDVEFDLQGNYGDLIRSFGQADLIFCLEVFEYIYDPMQAFKNIRSLLKSRGSAWVSFPFVYPIHNPKQFDALRYTEPGIEQLAVANSLQVKEVIYRRPKPDNQHLLAFYSADGMRAAEAVDHGVTGYICKLK